MRQKTATPCTNTFRLTEHRRVGSTTRTSQTVWFQINAAPQSKISFTEIPRKKLASALRHHNPQCPLLFESTGYVTQLKKKSDILCHVRNPQDKFP